MFLISKGAANHSRASFIGRVNQADRKPEELDAVANELLSEFVLKKHENPMSSSSSSSSSSSQPKQQIPIAAPSAALVAPVSLSPLSTSSSSHSSSQSTSSSSTSSSDEEFTSKSSGGAHENELPTRDYLMNPVGGNSSITNKSGTLIIRRDSSQMSEKLKSLNIDSIPCIGPPEPPAPIQKAALEPTSSSSSLATPHSFISYNPNSKSVAESLPVANSQPGSSGGVSTVLVGAGSIIQPLNEPQIRKGNQVIINSTLSNDFVVF